MLQTMAKPGPLIDTDGACWAAVLRRDAGADGRFFTCVKTTGIYCRPSCGAKRPKRENVFFVATRAEAEAAGFRPCKRCRPEEAARPDARSEVVANACRMIEAAGGAAQPGKAGGCGWPQPVSFPPFVQAGDGPDA